MDLYKEALDAFAELFQQAKKSEPADANAMMLATAGLDARPHARVVLLKEFDERGFVFYTNVMSRKGQQLTENPHAALAFHWKSLQRQVHVEGSVTLVTADEANAYWSTRARVSQTGGWASLQSQTLEERKTLEERVQHFEKIYEGKNVPRPPHWSGFRVAPERIEVWKAEPHRLHQRTVYERAPSGWRKFLLYP